MSKPIQTISSVIAWACPWYHVRQDKIQLPDGSEGEYNVIVKEPAVWIVPVTPAGEIVLIRCYRHTVGDWCWEVPAGSLKPAQTPEEAALEELHEEIGGQPVELSYVSRFYTANGICNEVSHLYLARGVTLGKPRHEPAEVIQIHPTPIKTALAMARAGQISDGGSALALLLCERLLT